MEAELIVAVIVGLIIFVIGINHLFYYIGKGNRRLKVLLLPGILTVVGIALTIFCTVKLDKEIKGVEELNDNIQNYFTTYYKVNDFESLIILPLNEDGKYKIELLNGRKDVVKLDIKNREVKGIKIIDSSSNDDDVK